MSRQSDSSRREIRVDMGSLSDAEARALLKQHASLVRAVASDFHTLDQDDLRAIGDVAVLEAAITYKGTVPLPAWVAKVVRWRVRERAAAEIERIDQPREPFPEPLTNGRDDPERQFMLDQILSLLPYLPPNQAVIIAGRLRRETFEEIASTLGVRPQSTHQQYRLALAQIRDWLGLAT